MNVDQAKIYLKENNELAHYISDKEGANTFPLNCGIVGHVYNSEKPIQIANAYNDVIFNGNIDIDTSLPLICIPIISSRTQEKLGVFQVINPKVVDIVSKSYKSIINPLDYEILDFFSQQLAQNIIKNREIENLIKRQTN